MKDWIFEIDAIFFYFPNFLSQKKDTKVPNRKPLSFSFGITLKLNLYVILIMSAMKRKMKLSSHFVFHMASGSFFSKDPAGSPKRLR